MAEMISLEEAQSLVLSHVACMPTEVVSILDAVGRVAAQNLTSDIDISPFAHSAMDGFALRAAEIAECSPDTPVQLKVIAEVAAGDVFDGTINQGECVRIMTGAPLPQDADAVVKYEEVSVVEGDGLPGSIVAFKAPVCVHDNVRDAGEEARAGEVVVAAGEVIGTAGVGFLASCGITNICSYSCPRVGIIAIGSELVPATELPGPGKIRNSNSFALAACVQAAGGVATMLPIVEDTFEALSEAVQSAAAQFDFVITSGGASNGDFDFIKQVVGSAGELLMETVNIRPGKAQTFGIVDGTPVFGLPGNPAAAYCGFELIIRPALRKMQGYTQLFRSAIVARLGKDTRKKDPRRIYLRSTLQKQPDGSFIAQPAKNQSSGSFGIIQKSNCLAILPEGTGEFHAGDMVECLVLDVPEEVVL